MRSPKDRRQQGGNHDGHAIRRLASALAALVLMSGVALAQSKVTIAIGGAACLCYLPTVLAQQLGEYEKAGLNVEMVDFKGGSQSLTAVLGGSADVVSGYFDHCVNLAAKNQHLQSFVVYDRYPGFALVVSPKHADSMKSVKDLANKKVGVSAPGSSTDHFLKFILTQERRRSELGRRGRHRARRHRRRRHGAGLGRSRHHARSGGDANCRGKNKDMQILVDTRTQKDTIEVFGGEYPGGALYTKAEWIEKTSEGDAGADQRHRQHAQMDPLAHARRDHGEDAGRARRRGQGALSRGAEEHAADVLDHRQDGSQGRGGRAGGVQPVVPEVANAKIDLSKTYTNKFVEQAGTAKTN